MTELSTELLQMIANDPREFLRRNYRVEQRIKIKQERLAHIWQVGIAVTQTAKPAAAYTGPGDKTGSCAVELVALQTEIEDSLAELVLIQQETAFAIQHLVHDTTLRMILEAYYLSGMRWEEIACTMHYAYRWVQRLHRKGLNAMRIAAQSLCDVREEVEQQEQRNEQRNF